MRLLEWVLLALMVSAIVVLWTAASKDYAVRASFHKGFTDGLVVHREGMADPFLVNTVAGMRFELRACADYSALAWKATEKNPGEDTLEAAYASGADSFEACLVKSVKRLGPALTPQAREQLLSGLACRKDCQLLSLPGLGPWKG